MFQGLVVAPGSVHRSGRVYYGSAPTVPTVADLAELPEPLYEVLARRGRPKVAEPATTSGVLSRTRPASVMSVNLLSLDTTGTEHIKDLPCQVTQLLSDSSDGRNRRTLRAVTAMVRLGWADQRIVQVVLSSPLGSKAREQTNPVTWLQDKISWGRKYDPTPLDKIEYWWAVHTSGMSPGKIRILDVLLAVSSATGVVTRSQGWLAIDAAVGSTAHAIKELVRDGWMLVVRPPTTDVPTTYRLLRPDENLHPHQGLYLQREVPHHSPPTQLRLRVAFPVAVVRHDAFRCRQGSLHSAYPLLTLLRPEPQPVDRLADLLKVTGRAFNERLALLVRADIAVITRDGVAKTERPLIPLLDAAAVRAGTAGSRDNAIAAYYAKLERWRQDREQARIVGSPVWRRIVGKNYLDAIGRGFYDVVLPAYDHDAERLADWLVDTEAAALLAPHSPIRPLEQGSA